MAKPTVYKWTDTGAPILKPSDGIAGVEALFRACLIDGYGDQTIPVNGENPWSIPFSDPTGFILKQGGSNPRKLCLKFYDMMTSQGWVACQVAEEYSDFNTPVGGILTPEESTETTRYRRLPVGDGTSSYSIPWVIFATERTIICQFGYNAKSNDPVPNFFDSRLDDNLMYNGHWFFGDYLSYGKGYTTNQCLIHPYYTSSSYQEMCKAFLETSTGSITSYGSIILFGTKWDDPTTYGAYVPAMFLWLRGGSGGSSIGITSVSDKWGPKYPNALDATLHLDKYRMVADHALFGELPGLMYSYTGVPYEWYGQYKTIQGYGGVESTTLYNFGSALDSCYFVHDGEWGVE